MKLAHVIALDPTVAQANAFARAAGVSRFTYNWALAEWDRQYKAGEKPSANTLKKQFNTIKGEQFPWIYESPRDANSEAFADLGTAFSNYFNSLNGKRKGKKLKRPVFHKRGDNDGFYVSNDRFHFEPDGTHVVLPVIGIVKIHETLRLDGKIIGARVKRRADHWFLSVQMETEARRPTAPIREIVGVDLGLKTAIVVSSGEVFEAPKPLRAALKKLRRQQRELHRRKKGGKNREMTRKAIAKAHARVGNIRKDFWHKATTQLCRENQAVVGEGFSMAFMIQNKHLARTASDVALGMFRPMMEYKSKIYGCEFIVADQLFPSTQRCSGCGNIRTGDNKVALGTSVYACDACGLIEDRDRNAAINLEHYPRLEGKWRSQPQNAHGDCASTRRAKGRRASAVDEVGTNTCALVRTL